MSTSATRNAGSAFCAQRRTPATGQRDARWRSRVDVARQWTAIGDIVADLAPADGAPPRQARLHISFGLLAQAPTPWAARLWEQDAPSGVRPVEWLLGSRRSVTCLEDALELLECTQGLVTAYALT